MEIYMQKIGFLRPDSNPKNTRLNVNLDWAIEFTNTEKSDVNFDIVLKSCENFNFSFKIEGIVKLDLFEDFLQEEISQVIFDQACNVLMDMISITRETVHFLSNKKEYSDLGSEHIHGALFN